ncbi:hypothetical protein [Thiolinea disciformis]|uniref:hypothetical protein n=1 Tax=Thiolinea disciformis TaxID=125614 RepID=UPI00035E944C|nr:hypothetical protein [Thiolinea disciformis]
MFNSVNPLNPFSWLNIPVNVLNGIMGAGSGLFGGAPAQPVAQPPVFQGYPQYGFPMYYPPYGYAPYAPQPYAQPVAPQPKAPQGGLLGNLFRGILGGIL